MRPYGLPRNTDVESPDLLDTRLYGLKSSKSRIKEKSGDTKNSFRSSNIKRNTRRIWKKKERSAQKRILHTYLLNREK